MLYFYTGTNTDRLREKMNAAAGKTGAPVIRITDAHRRADLEAALSGGGLFAEARVIVLDNVLGNPDLGEVVLARLAEIERGEDPVHLIESTIDATTRKLLERHAESTEKIDAPKQAKQESVFTLANALQRGQKKELWVGYQREIVHGKAPEAIHGVLFWAAKQMCLRSPSEKAKKLVADLAELPHDARRQGFDLEYALERFVLTAV